MQSHTTPNWKSLHHTQKHQKLTHRELWRRRRRRRRRRLHQMFILHRMASSHSLFASSLFSNPISTNSSLPSNFNRFLTCQFRAFPLLNNKRNAFSTSTSAAVATGSSPETSVADKNQEFEPKTDQNLENEKVVLPTNESSEKLLRIRHTVICFRPRWDFVA